MLYAVLVRTLREGATYDDFRRSWLRGIYEGISEDDLS